jgi:hypothetical protein
MTDVLVRDSDLRNLLYATADWVQLGPVAANARASLDAALTTRLMASTDCDPLPVALSPREAIAIVGPLLRSIAGEDWTDADTWHGGIGSDLCEACTALIKIRALTGAPVADGLRP